MDDNKAKALKAALGQIEKQFGKNTIMHLGDDSVAMDVDVFCLAVRFSKRVEWFVLARLYVL